MDKFFPLRISPLTVPIFLSALRFLGGGEARWMDVGVPGLHRDLARVRSRLHLHDRHSDRGQPQEAGEEGGQEVQGRRAEGFLQQDPSRALGHERAGQVRKTYPVIN